MTYKVALHLNKRESIDMTFVRIIQNYCMIFVFLAESRKT